MISRCEVSLARREKGCPYLLLDSRWIWEEGYNGEETVWLKKLLGLYSHLSDLRQCWGKKMLNRLESSYLGI